MQGRTAAQYPFVKIVVTQTPQSIKLSCWKITVTDVASPMSVNPAAPHPRGVFFGPSKKIPRPELQTGDRLSTADQYLKVTVLDVVETL